MKTRGLGWFAVITSCGGFLMPAIAHLGFTEISAKKSDEDDALYSNLEGSIALGTFVACVEQSSAAHARSTRWFFVNVPVQYFGAFGFFASIAAWNYRKISFGFSRFARVHRIDRWYAVAGIWQGFISAFAAEAFH